MDINTNHLDINKEGNKVTLRYLDSSDTAREYLFPNEQDAELFCLECRNLMGFLGDSPDRKRAMLHEILLYKSVLDQTHPVDWKGADSYFPF
ncbi:Hypothetical protein Tpal_2211 [Trichococcus palustris]|jgi:hypothetical protein|uniref:Uncharacterized protein n=1 Tax=Trichococcus palustris TaxID=140314 RepID=A0A143YUY6_9LACT|nr:hypothetical protein [Trichococcus palustris]CZQ98030.1 Hypothetical protein Tpal_2211 [Trichococcus palustris]SFL15318.1 hypothetical protein SAMN04488076_12522 [Trichococcus palustris]